MFSTQDENVLKHVFVSNVHCDPMHVLFLTLINFLKYFLVLSSYMWKYNF